MKNSGRARRALMQGGVGLLAGAIGAAAFTRTVVDPDYDDGSEPVTLAIFGKVPPGLADQLPF